jgi:hypothetical protein
MRAIATKEMHMIHGSRHCHIAVCAASKVRRANPAALLLPGLILLAAISPAAAEPASCAGANARGKYSHSKSAWCAHQSVAAINAATDDLVDKLSDILAKLREQGIRY